MVQKRHTCEIFSERSTSGSNYIHGGKVMEGSEMAHETVIPHDDASILVQPRKGVLHHNTGAVLQRAAGRAFSSNAITQAMLL
jgi:hypothetical protein